MFKVIVITQPFFFEDEAGQIVWLLTECGVDLVHIRKPDSTAEQVAGLIDAVPSELHHRLVLHDHHHLAVRYKLYGIHLNSRNPLPPEGWQGSASRSCHTLNEVVDWKPKCSYLSLSPIFDSISKMGYKSAFTSEQISEAVRLGIIDHKVFALGGITFDRLSEVEQMGFGGAMILGDAWKIHNHNS
ncbi:MAG: thiamine phosphate synthase [Prevotella sp.]|nr:thiamine phosphate synthase [Prevotella sp.]